MDRQEFMQQISDLRQGKLRLEPPEENGLSQFAGGTKASETGESWEQFCERFGILYAYGPKATVKFSVSTVISREFFDAYGPQATINAIRRDCFRSMDAMLKIEGKSID